MATWKCESCGATREGRCKPKKCTVCGASNTFNKEENANKGNA